MSTSHNLHVPLDESAWRALRDESARSKLPATALARMAIDQLLSERRRARVRDDIAAFAAAYAGSPVDLDAALEAAGIDAIREQR